MGPLMEASSCLELLNSASSEEDKAVFQDKRLPIKKWSRGPLLGCGAFGSVNLALCHQTGQLFAVKSVDVDRSSEHLRCLENEAELLRSINSPRIVRFLGCDWSVEDGLKKRNILMEHMPGGSVSDLMKKFGGKLAEPIVREFTKGLVEALRDLHRRGIVHCDVKGKNLLVGSNGVKLCDLGAAYRVEKGVPRKARTLSRAVRNSLALDDTSGLSAVKRGERSRSPFKEGTRQGPTKDLPSGIQPEIVGNKTCGPRTSGLRGTIGWMAPEAVKKGEGGMAGDIWSVGCTVIEMTTGRSPWGRQVSDAYSALYKIGCTDELPTFPEGLSPEGCDFLQRCLQRDPSQRPSAGELLRHPFVSQSNEKVPTRLAPVDHPLNSQVIRQGSQSPTSVLSQSMWNSAGSTSSRCPSEIGCTGSQLAGPPSDVAASCSSPNFRSVSGVWSSERDSIAGTPSPAAASSSPRPLSAGPHLPVSRNGDCEEKTEALDNTLTGWNGFKLQPPVLNTAEIGPAKEWCWWASPGNPTAGEGKWLVVHSPRSSEASQPSSPACCSPKPQSQFQLQPRSLSQPEWKSQFQAVFSGAEGQKLQKWEVPSESMAWGSAGGGPGVRRTSSARMAAERTPVLAALRPCIEADERGAYDRELRKTGPGDEGTGVGEACAGAGTPREAVALHQRDRMLEGLQPANQTAWDGEALTGAGRCRAGGFLRNGDKLKQDNRFVRFLVEPEASASVSRISEPVGL